MNTFSPKEYISIYLILDPIRYMPRGSDIAEMQMIIHPCFDDPLSVWLKPVCLDISHRLGVFLGIFAFKLD